MNIGVYSSGDSPVEATIRVRDFSLSEVYPVDVRVRAAIIKESFSFIEPDCSWIERDQRDLLGNSNFTYGEVRFHSLYPLLQHARPKAGEVFYDLGCGTGLPCAIAGIMFPQLASSGGVEYLETMS